MYVVSHDTADILNVTGAVKETGRETILIARARETLKKPIDEVRRLGAAVGVAPRRIIAANRPAGKSNAVTHGAAQM